MTAQVQRAGFVGLGNMGKPMASRLVAAGFETHVFDVAEAPVQELVAEGAKAAATPRELAAASDAIGVCVRDDADVRAVCLGEDGLFAGAAGGTVVAIHSTILPGTVSEVAEAGRDAGVSVVDACVTGGAARAVQGDLAILVGGDSDAIERARPAFESYASKVIDCGELGNGCKTKLCLNLITYIQWAAAYESHHLAKAVGLPQEVLEEAGRANGQITELMVQYLALHKMPDEARGSEAVQNLVRGHTLVAEKDLAWSLQLAREAGIALPVGGLVSQLMARIYALEDEGRR